VSGPDRIAADRDFRRLAQSEFERSVVVVAGAGTGKTALLVSRVVVWCVGPGWVRHAEDDQDRSETARKVIEKVVAITFTEAAAAEMARKIGNALIELARGDSPIGWDPQPELLPSTQAEIRVRARALSEESHRLVVSTIHAFCQRLLSTYPLEAGIHPHSEVDPDGARLQVMAEEMVEEALRDLDRHPDRSGWERLAVEGIGPPEVVAALCDLSEAGADPVVFDQDPFGERAAQATVDRLRSVLDSFNTVAGDRLEQIRGSVSVVTRDGVAMLSAWVDTLESTASFDEVSAFLTGLDDRVVPRLKKWSKIDLTGSERSCFGESVYEIAAAAGHLAAVLTPLIDPPREQLAAARQVVAPLLTDMVRNRNATGVLTFSDLLRKADSLLRSSEGVRREVVAGIDHLLVDEFQDTDVVQCRIVESLALGGPKTDRPALFIVGDPKQSIYAWRNADLEAYDDFVDRVRSNGGVIVDLVRNFRSVTPILDEVERLVAPVMREEHGVQPRFEALEATDERRGAPGFDRSPWSGVEHWLAWPEGPNGVAPEKGNSDVLTSALEADALAIDIARLHRQGGIDRWGDVAVLLRVTTAQEELLDAFRRHGIPYEVAREREYYRQREVVEIAALVRCVLEPTDMLALLTVVRSDVVGVPDVALAPLWDAGFGSRLALLGSPGDPNAMASVMDCIDEASSLTPAGVPGGGKLPRWPVAVKGAVEIIAGLRWSLRHEAPDEFVERIRTTWLAEVTGAARYLGRFRRARLDRFFADLENSLVADDGGDAALARFLRRAVEEGRENRLPLPPDLEADAVHVMTIHRAKGLDFEHVYVAQIHKGGRGGGRRETAGLIEVDGHTEYHLFNWTTSGFVAGEWFQARKTQAESVRLLYVATTRAKQRLVVSGGWPAPGKVVPPEAAVDFAGLIGRRLDSESTSRQVETGLERTTDHEDGVQRVMPVFADADDGAKDRDDTTTIWDPGKLDLKMIEELAGARLAAAERMDRPVIRSASAEAHDRLLRADIEGDASSDAPHSRDLAMAIGTAVHRLLETIDLGEGLANQVLESREIVVSEITTGMEPNAARGAAKEVDDLLHHLASSACLEQLSTLAPALVARELPVYGWEESEEGPGTVVSGIVDLVYRDPEDGKLVVADYKTDALVGDDAFEERAEVYRPQVHTYAKILRDALDLAEEPHVELWFLAADRIVRL
jgi:ATP-dependent helicase/nuclease subunit A